jgi:hypothetical protein
MDAFEYFESLFAVIIGSGIGYWLANGQRTSAMKVVVEATESIQEARREIASYRAMIAKLKDDKAVSRVIEVMVADFRLDRALPTRVRYVRPTSHMAGVISVEQRFPNGLWAPVKMVYDNGDGDVRQEDA